MSFALIDGNNFLDILKYGPDVEVLGPASLRKRMRELLTQANRRYA